MHDFKGNNQAAGKYEHPEKLDHLKKAAEDAPVVRLVNCIIKEDKEKNIWKIRVGRVGTKMLSAFMTSDGVYFPHAILPFKMREAIFARLKDIAEMDITSVQAQSSRFVFKWDREDQFPMRAFSSCGREGEAFYLIFGEYGIFHITTAEIFEILEEEYHRSVRENQAIFNVALKDRGGSKALTPDCEDVQPEKEKFDPEIRRAPRYMLHYAPWEEGPNLRAVNEGVIRPDREFMIGRSITPQVDLPLPSKDIKPNHARIFCWGERFCLQTLERGAVLLNGERIKDGETYFLEDGDILTFGEKEDWKFVRVS